MRTLRIGTRASALARWQTEHVARALRALDPSLALETVELLTAGDERPEAPLERLEGTGFFSSAIERALLEERIDIAVHSYKDLPTAPTAGLVVGAVPERGPAEDALCASHGARLDALPRGARVGTSSLRRTAQLRRLRPDLDCRPLRGNVPTRLERLGRGELDAVVLARAGLERLGLADAATEIFSTEVMLPAPAQGALAAQARAADAPVLELLAAVDHAPSRRAVEAERALLGALRGGCSVPVGAHARERGGKLVLDAGIFDPEGTKALRVRIEGELPLATGEAAARALLAQGAREILEGLERAPRLAAPWTP